MIFWAPIAPLHCQLVFGEPDFVELLPARLPADSAPRRLEDQKEGLATVMVLRLLPRATGVTDGHEIAARCARARTGMAVAI